MPSYELKRSSRFFEAVRSIVEYEVRSGNTVSFLAEVDLSAVERVRSAAVAAERPKPSYTAFVVKAVSLAIAETPYANRRLVTPLGLPFLPRYLQSFRSVDVAVQVERDLEGEEVATFADVLRDANQRSLDDTVSWLKKLGASTTETNEQWRTFHDLITRVPHWLSKFIIRLPLFLPSLWVKYRGGAVLVNSPARYGVDVLVATWTWPIAISFGLVKKRPVVRDDRVVPCQTFTLIMNFDRRVMAGAQAARFFHRMVEILEDADHSMQ